MKLVVYLCENCNKQIEEYYSDSEEETEKIECKECNEWAFKFNFKNNPHRYRYIDK